MKRIARSPQLQGVLLYGWLDGSLCNIITLIGWVTIVRSVF
ncbi:hypothetical protein [Desulfosporosinus sp.]|nr:hypothetical protein [Desulfosporosinus sp.]